jgi:1,2-dihydroxy-3-keto-5-methylthiopentene dioxygenase
MTVSSDDNENHHHKTATGGEEALVEPESKKPKMAFPQAPDEDWPEAWLMIEGEIIDQKAPNRREPNVPVKPDQMRHLGICYWKMDADSYEYPTVAVPWDPKVRK